MSLEVLEVSGLATVQDLGRRGWRRFGVPASGPMDVFSFHAANTLLGNSSTCAVLEMGMGGITFRALHDCVIGVAGVGYTLSIYVWDFPLWSSYFVRAGWTVRLDKLDSGMWAYLAVMGGVQAQLTLGSRSTYLRGALGGLEGRQLQAGDVIGAGILGHSSYELAARTLPEEARPKYTDHPTIDIIMGPQTDCFTSESIKTFLSGEYSISLTYDRMGYRLDGPTLIHRNNAELISEGLTFGAIQVPSNGGPIVMMADCPTTGGYPKIGAVASADLPLLVQCTPNKSRFRFRETTVMKAQQKYRMLMSQLSEIIEE